MIVEDAVLVDTTMYGCYTKGSEPDENGNMVQKVYSTYQRNEVAERWQRKDGSILLRIRHKTKKESEKMRKEEAESLQKAIDEGRAVRDRIGRIKWTRH